MRLRSYAERAKNSIINTSIIETLYDGIDFNSTISRAKLEEINMTLFRNTMAPVGKLWEMQKEKK